MRISIHTIRYDKVVHLKDIPPGSEWLVAVGGAHTVCEAFTGFRKGLQSTAVSLTFLLVTVNSTGPMTYGRYIECVVYFSTRSAWFTVVLE